LAGANSALPNTLAEFEGVTSRRKRDGKRKAGKRKESKEMEGTGKKRPPPLRKYISGFSVLAAADMNGSLRSRVVATSVITGGQTTTETSAEPGVNDVNVVIPRLLRLTITGELYRNKKSI